jgi:hypothetical protein
VSSSIVPFLALFLAFAGQVVPDERIVEVRAQLETTRRDLLANIADPALMQDSARAAIVRRSIEQNWTKCAANEGTALAKASERPARLLAEAALAACQPWEKAYVTALDKGAYPYPTGLVSREDMVAEQQLQSRDAAMGRIMMWRGVPSGSASAGPPAPAAGAKPETVNRDLAGSSSPSILLQPAYPKPPAREPAAAAAPAPGDTAELVVVAQVRNTCAVRFADHTLTESELAERAKAWAAAGTPLRIVRPRGATYGCLAKIAQHLGEYGVHLLQVVEP